MAIWYKAPRIPVKFEPIIMMTHNKKYDVELGCFTKDRFYDKYGKEVLNVYAWANIRDIVPKDKYANFTN